MNSSTEDLNVAEEIIERISRRTEEDPLELPLLYESIDTEALERLLASSDGYVSVEFSYCGYDIAVDGNRGIEILEHRS